MFTNGMNNKYIYLALTVPGTIMFIYATLYNIYNGLNIILIPILQMRKLRQRTVQQLVVRVGANPTSLAPQSVLLIVVIIPLQIRLSTKVTEILQLMQFQYTVGWNHQNNPPLLLNFRSKFITISFSHLKAFNLEKRIPFPKSINRYMQTTLPKVIVHKYVCLLQYQSYQDRTWEGFVQGTEVNPYNTELQLYKQTIKSKHQNLMLWKARCAPSGLNE